jgi:hypothetical protein
MSGLAYELRVLAIGDRTRTDGEVVDVRLVRRTLILLAVLGAHDEFASGNSRHLQQRVVSHLLWVECT